MLYTILSLQIQFFSASSNISKTEIFTYPFFKNLSCRNIMIMMKYHANTNMLALQTLV